MNQPQSQTQFLELNRQVASVSLDFDRQQALLQMALQRAIYQASLSSASTGERKVSHFSGAWLPGPLSYPWLVMIASLPQVLEVFWRAA